jgi:isochorismate pyruvate lyase
MKQHREIKECQTLVEVRQYIDALDARIVALLGERCAYVAQAARFKPDVNGVHDNERVEYIVQRARAMGQEHGAPGAVVEATYRALIAAATDFEKAEFQRNKAGAKE